MQVTHLETLVWYDSPQLAVFACDGDLDLLAMQIPAKTIDGVPTFTMVAVPATPEQIAAARDLDGVRETFQAARERHYRIAWSDTAIAEIVEGPVPEDDLPGVVEDDAIDA